MRSAPSGTTGDRLRSRSGRDASQSHATAWASASGPEGRVCWSRPIGSEQGTRASTAVSSPTTTHTATPGRAVRPAAVRCAAQVGRTVCGVTSTGRFVLGGSSRRRRRLGRAGRRHRGARAVTPRGGTAAHQQRAIPRGLAATAVRTAGCVFTSQSLPGLDAARRQDHDGQRTARWASVPARCARTVLLLGARSPFGCMCWPVHRVERRRVAMDAGNLQIRM